MSTIKNIAAAALSFVLIAGAANAQTAIPTSYASVTNADEFGVKYLGSDAEYLVFEVKIESPVLESASFKVEDGNEGVLYSANQKDMAAVKRVKIEKKDYQSLNFKLVVGKKTYSKSFSVNTSMIERTNVAESEITKL
ncbi:MAG: hypothetical protein V4725_04690 [Bacteroidota bacterium]